MAHQWRPDLHPRGRHGKFARKGGGKAAAALATADNPGKAVGGPINHPTLSAAERKAVHSYTGSGYNDLNQYVQAGNKVPSWITDEDYRQRIADNATALRSAINRSVLTRPLSVRRRIHPPVAEKVFGPVGFHVGHTLTEQRFASTTTADDVSRGEFGRVLLRYRLKAGTKALDVNHAGDGKASEQELILGPGQRFRVVDDRIVDGQREISLEAV